MFSQLNFWHWWIAAGLFLIFEMVVPVTFFLWLAGAAVLTGVVALLAPGMGWEGQVLLFSLLALVIVAWSPRLLRHRRPASDQPTLNRRGAQYVGRTFTLEEPIENGYGKIRVDDTTWRIRGEDLPTGSKVKVTGVDGTLLLVAAAS